LSWSILLLDPVKSKPTCPQKARLDPLTSFDEFNLLDKPLPELKQQKPTTLDAQQKAELVKELDPTVLKVEFNFLFHLFC
jgi:hypothetical protein